MVKKEKMVTDQQHVWNQISTSYKTFSLALEKFLSKDIDRVVLMRDAIYGNDQLTAIFLLRYLSQDELMQLFKELVFLSSYSRGTLSIVREAILSLPRDWVLQNIEQIANPILEKGDYDEYRRILELYLELDRELTRKLANQAINHKDPDIKEAGEDFLLKLSGGV